jgi:bifunctional DNase/RNase
MAELEVAGIRVLEDRDQPVMVLRVVGTTRYLPVWVDTISAAALMSVVEGELKGPALTFELMDSLLTRLGSPALAGRITGWDEGHYSAELVVDGEAISARLSDIAALSFVEGFPISCSDELVAQLSVEAFEQKSNVVEEFKSFLDHVDPDDFES